MNYRKAVLKLGVVPNLAGQVFLFFGGLLLANTISNNTLGVTIQDLIVGTACICLGLCLTIISHTVRRS